MLESQWLKHVQTLGWPNPVPMLHPQVKQPDRALLLKKHPVVDEARFLKKVLTHYGIEGVRFGGQLFSGSDLWIEGY